MPARSSSRNHTRDWAPVQSWQRWISRMVSNPAFPDLLGAAGEQEEMGRLDRVEEGRNNLFRRVKTLSLWHTPCAEGFYLTMQVVQISRSNRIGRWSLLEGLRRAVPGQGIQDRLWRAERQFLEKAFVGAPTGSIVSSSKVCRILQF